LFESTQVQLQALSVYIIMSWGGRWFFFPFMEVTHMHCSSLSTCR